MNSSKRIYFSDGMITNFEDEKEINWKDRPALQQFCFAVDWEDEQGNPFKQSTKQEWLETMNDNQKSDIAGVTYRPNSDLVELWHAKFMQNSPFIEKGIWVVIPGIRRCIFEQAQNQAGNEIP